MSSSTIPSRAREYRLPQRTAFSDLTLVEADVPTPGPDEVLVKMHAGSLQFRDLMIAATMYPPPMKENVIPGSDAAGEVVAVGPTKWSDKSWTVGDRVAGQFSQLHLSGGVKSRAELGSGLGGGWDGVFTEYKIFPASGLVRIPDSLSYQEAATLPCAALTAYNCLFGSGSHVLVAGQWVLAQGTGGVSVFAAQFALSVGANIIITSSSDAKLEKVKVLAGDRAHLLHTVNYKTHPDWDNEVLAITKGEGVDFIVEVGGQGTIEKSFSSIALGGMIGAIGFVAGDAKTPVPNVNGMALGHAATLRGILIGSRQQFEAMNNHITATGLKPLIDKVFEFEQLKEAYDYQWSQKHVGKVVIQISKQ